MDKTDMREWVASVEKDIDVKLNKWLKVPKIENGEAVQLRWQFELTHFQLNIFWEDKKEIVTLHYLSPRVDHTFLWHGLDRSTFRKIEDNIGNLATRMLRPPIDPEEHTGLNG